HLTHTHTHAEPTHTFTHKALTHTHTQTHTHRHAPAHHCQIIKLSQTSIITRCFFCAVLSVLLHPGDLHLQGPGRGKGIRQAGASPRPGSGGALRGGVRQDR